MFVRFVIHLFVIVGIMLSVAIYMEWIMPNEPISVIVFIGLVMAVYIMVVSIELYRSKKLADRLTKKLNYHRLKAVGCPAAKAA